MHLQYVNPQRWLVNNVFVVEDIVAVVERFDDIFFITYWVGYCSTKPISMVCRTWVDLPHMARDLVVDAIATLTTSGYDVLLPNPHGETTCL